MDSTNPNSQRYCHCTWGKCRELTTLFRNEEDEFFSKGCFQLQFNKANDDPKTLYLTPQQYLFFVCVCTNTGIDKSILKFSDDGYFRLSVARHHWERAAVRYLDGHGGITTTHKPATLVSKEVAKRFRFDERWHFDKPDNHGRIVRKYFIPPNHPHDEILKYAKVEYNYGDDGALQESNSQTLTASSQATAVSSVSTITFEDSSSNKESPRKRRKQNREQTRQRTIDENEIIRMNNEFNNCTPVEYEALKKENKKLKDDLKNVNKKLAESQERNSKSTQKSGEQQRLQLRYKSDVSTSHTTNKTKRVTIPKSSVVYTDNQLSNHMKKILCEIGGLSRFTLSCDEYHRKHPSLSKDLFGLGKNWKELKIYIQIFSGVDANDVSQRPAISIEKEGLDRVRLTEFEQILIALFFMMSVPHRTKLGYIFDKSRSSIAQVLEKYLPKWAKIGEFLSILPMYPDYYRKELPNEYIKNGYESIGFLLDGKDALCQTIRKNDNLRRSQHSSKMKASAWRIIMWTTCTGLTFEHTRPMGARADECKMVQCHSTLGRAYADLESWKDYAIKNPIRSDLKYWTVNNELKTLRELLLEELQNKSDSINSDGSSSDRNSDSDINSDIESKKLQQ